jgi:hypothetical protein
MLFSRRRNNFAIASLAVYAGALVAAVLFFSSNQFFPVERMKTRETVAAAGTEGQHYTGTVVIPAKVAGQCQRLEFDNVTGALREGTSGACSADPGVGNSTTGRMSAIRESFNRH